MLQIPTNFNNGQYGYKIHRVEFGCTIPNTLSKCAFPISRSQQFNFDPVNLPNTRMRIQLDKDTFMMELVVLIDDYEIKATEFDDGGRVPFGQVVHLLTHGISLIDEGDAEIIEAGGDAEMRARFVSARVFFAEVGLIFLSGT